MLRRLQEEQPVPFQALVQEQELARLQEQVPFQSVRVQVFLSWCSRSCQRQKVQLQR